MKQKIEIEIDVPEGFEATGEYRKPEVGELMLIDECRELRAVTCTNPIHGYDRFILRKIAPKTFGGKVQLQPGWLAKDKDGSFWWFSAKPGLGTGRWDRLLYQGLVHLLYIVDPFPPDLPWDQCCMQVVPEAGK